MNNHQLYALVIAILLGSCGFDVPTAQRQAQLILQAAGVSL